MLVQDINKPALNEVHLGSHCSNMDNVIMWHEHLKLQSCDDR